MLASHFAIKEQALLNPGLNTSQEGVIFKQAREDQREYPNNLIDFLVPSTAKMSENVDRLLQKGREDETTSSAFNDLSTPPPAVDVCPHDVLYISDLVSFSSRFCGSNSRLNKTLVFGSPVEMIEVIMELITTTDRGRGFAMLFSYQNDTVVTALGMNSIIGEESVILLAVIAAMISFALVLMLVLCLSYRQKICPKRAQEPDLVTQHPVSNHFIYFQTPFYTSLSHIKVLMMFMIANETGNNSKPLDLL
ncbi:uncharacterized protein LOC128646973 [Bombina bombina]|uniref:uncharacterized protein LOC128646973 n=1 Tax=Bombina bombina TaxID=8345 RepID=UPI00235ABA1D|nr:uncharacterized protein LOC128646973 [Bombina bombina]